MKRSPHEPLRDDEQEHTLKALADLMRAGATPPPASQHLRRRMLQAWQQDALPNRRRWVFMWAPLAAACVLAAFVGWQWRTTHAALQVVATRGGSSTQPSIGAMMPEDTELRFSEGTIARVQAKSRAMVSRLDAHGATVTLADGALHLNVVKRPQAAWRVQAGPYLVQVTGTRFDVRWDEAHKQFQIDLQEGSVRVSGPALSTPQALTAGHTLRVDGEKAAMTITPLRMETSGPMAPPVPRAPPAGATPAVVTPSLPRPRRVAYVADHERVPNAPAMAAAPQNTEPQARIEAPTLAPAPANLPPLEPAPPPAPPPKPPATWATWLQAGDFAAIVSDAERQQVDTVVAERPLADLQALADAGRYTGNAAVARKALQALRTRFADSAAAQKAAFELGRLEDDHAHAPARAVPWYVRYLSESPRGAFAEDALVRLMMAHTSLKQHDLAALDADKYLQLYPTGSHSDLAKKVLRRAPGSPR